VDRDFGAAATPSALGAPGHTRRSGHGRIGTGQIIAKGREQSSGLELADMGIFQGSPQGLSCFPRDVIEAAVVKGSSL